MYRNALYDQKLTGSKIFSIYLAAGLLALSACQKDQSTATHIKGSNPGTSESKPQTLQSQDVEKLYSMEIFGESSNPHLTKSVYTFDSHVRMTQKFSYNPTLGQWTPSDLRKSKTHELTKNGFKIISDETLSYRTDSDGNEILMNSANEDMVKSTPERQIDLAGKNLLEMMEITNINSSIRNKLSLEDIDFKEHGKIFLKKIVYLKDYYSVNIENNINGQDLCEKDQQKAANCLTEVTQLSTINDENSDKGPARLNPEDLSISYCNLEASPDCKETLPIKGKLEKSVINNTDIYTIQTPLEYLKKDSKAEKFYTVIKGKLYSGLLIKSGTESSIAYLDEAALNETTQLLSKALFNISNAPHVDLQNSSPANR